MKMCANFQEYAIPNLPSQYSPNLSAVGLDLGTTRCCAAINRENRIDVIALDNMGTRSLPSFVSFDEKHVKCGEIAAKRMSHYCKHTVYDVKRIIGKRIDSINIDPVWPFEVVKDDDEKVKIKTLDFQKNELKILPEVISAELLKHMKLKLEEYQGKPLFEAVLTVPRAFTPSQINATIEAATLASWTTVHILPEPIAACFAYLSDPSIVETITNSSNLMLFDLGGGTLDICILHVSNGIVKILGSFGDLYIGGRDFDSLLIKHFTAILSEKYGINVMGNVVKRQKLMSACQGIKEDLSYYEVVFLEVDCFDPNSSDQIQISRAQFCQLSQDLMLKISDLIHRALDKLKMIPNDISKVLLVGGGSKMPIIGNLIKSIFPTADLCRTQDPDWAVAYGAALYCCELKHSRQRDGASSANLDLLADVAIMLSEGLLPVIIDEPPDIEAPQEIVEAEKIQEAKSDKKLNGWDKTQREAKRVWKTLEKTIKF